MHDLPLLQQLTKQLETSGTKDARNKAIAILRDRGHMHPDSERLTAEGQKRDAMGAAGRAIDRASKASGKPSHHYEYNPHTNRATLKKR
jgi:hypothetical protein